MTDLASIKNILDRADINYEEGQRKASENDLEHTIRVERARAVTVLLFDKYGKLVDMGGY